MTNFYDYATQEALDKGEISPDDAPYLYSGFGDHCVLLCQHGDISKWRNAIILNPDTARELGAHLIDYANKSEQPFEDDDQ